ncbi:hypothetical protein A2U01_0078008, partial [Trifolium medium]|nr:hypothetical protein [Trifolium medium]
MVNSIDELEEEGDHEIEDCLQHLESSRVDESPKVEELRLEIVESSKGVQGSLRLEDLGLE